MKATDRFSPPHLRRAAALLALLVCGVASLAQTPSAPTPAAAPGKTIVADVLIQGNVTVSSQAIKAQLRTRPGAEFNDETAREDVRTLMASKQFGNVEVVSNPAPGGGILVYFLIRDYPNLVQKIIYKGAKHPSDDDLNGLHSVRPNSPLNPTANKLACQAIVKKYNDEGRPFAECHLLKGDKAGDTEVVFQITEGPKVSINSIAFAGNTFVSGPVLATHLNASSSILGIGGTYNPLMVDGDIGKLEEYYRQFGFLDVKIACERQWTPNGSEVNLVFHIVEGKRYQIQDTPHVTGNKALPSEQLDQILKVKAHDYFDQIKIDQDKRNLGDYYGLTGRSPRVEPNVVYSPDASGLVRVNYQVEEQPIARVGQVFVIGNERTRQEIILRQLGLYPGQILTYPDMRVAERNLARLGIFQITPDGAVKPTVTLLDNPSDPNSEYKDVLVTVQEDNTGSLMFGVGVNSDAGLTGSVVLNERNFDITRPPKSIDDLLSGNAWRGAGQEFRVEAVPGTQLQRYSATWREPYLFDSLFSLSVGGYYYQRQYDEDVEGRLGGRVTVGRRLTDTITANIGVRAENVNIGSVPFNAPDDYTSVLGNHFQLGTRLGLTYDTRDSVVRATEGSQIDVSYEQIVGDRVFPLVNLEASKFFTVYQRADGTGRHVVALHSQISWAGDNTPVYERYFAGGFRSLRGFAFRGVGPEKNGYMVGGDFQFLNSIEYQVPILANDKFYGVAFLDTGTVESRPDLKNYRVSAGVGVRFQLPMLGQVPIALDFGFPIIKADTDRTQVFSFWLGFSK